MEKEFVPYEQALKLKELGFDEPCLGSYYSYLEENFKEGKFDYRGELNIEYSIYSENTYYILAPTFSQAFRFFREEYNLICRVDVTSYGCTLDKQEFYCEITSKNGTASYEIWNTYEKAELDCLVKLIEIVKKQNLKG